MSKTEVLERRAAAREERAAAEEALAEGAKTRKQEDERKALRKQMANDTVRADAAAATALRP